MASMYRSYAQQAPRSKYILSLSSGTGFTLAALQSAVTTYAQSVLQYEGPIVNTTAASTFLGNISTRSFNSSVAFMDLGKLLVFQTRGQDMFRFRLVQEINGGSTEGVPGNYPTNQFYICVWSADPSVKAVRAARSG